MGWQEQCLYLFWTSLVLFLIYLWTIGTFIHLIWAQEFFSTGGNSLLTEQSAAVGLVAVFIIGFYGVLDLGGFDLFPGSCEVPSYLHKGLQQRPAHSEHGASFWTWGYLLALPRVPFCSYFDNFPQLSAYRLRNEGWKRTVREREECYSCCHRSPSSRYFRDATRLCQFYWNKNLIEARAFQPTW